MDVQHINPAINNWRSQSLKAVNVFVVTVRHTSVARVGKLTLLVHYLLALRGHLQYHIPSVGTFPGAEDLRCLLFPTAMEALAGKPGRQH